MNIDVLVEMGIKKNDGIFTYKVPTHLQNKIKKGVRALVPLGKNKIEGFILKINNEQNFDYQLKEIYDVIDENPVINDEMINIANYIKQEYLSSLIAAYQVMLPSALRAKEKINIKIKEEKYIELNKPAEEIKNYIDNSKAKKQIEVLKHLIKVKKILKSNYNSTLINSLVNKKLIKITTQEINRYNISDCEVSSKLTLTNEQQLVYNSVKLNNSETYLLHGVTGSGKTEIYMQLIADVIKNNKQAIVLVPEISLTPQMIANFKARFQNQIAVFHSRLSSGEKYDEYRKVLNNEVKIVIGARSAIFMPFNNIGLIVIDEEHEASYKQDNNPRYNTIDIAILRSKTHNCPILLGTATPSLESYARALKGVYKLLELKVRVKNLLMPKIDLIDMASEYKKGNFIFSQLLTNKIKDRLNKKEQIILLLNRRGYSNYLICTSCSYVHKCPNCDISLTYHKTTNNLKCHYCGHQQKLIDECPSCHNKTIRNMGLGTQKVEEELTNQFNAKVIRMDLDTTSQKNSHEKILTAFKNNQYDILLGTQMIAKGLDFNNVTLVGVLNGDSSLNIPDFRSSERTFQLISQVAGRAGRNTPGEVIIQSFNVDHYSIIAAKNHDYKSFYNYEMQIRKNLKYPPFYYITLINIKGKQYEEVLSESKKIKQYLLKNISDTSIILGPTTANLFKVNNIYRFQIIVKYKFDNKLKSTLQKINEIYNENYKINIDIDFNPLKL